MSRLCCHNREVIGSEVNVELVCEVRREKTGDTSLLGATRETCDSILFLPLYLLSMVYLSLHIWVLVKNGTLSDKCTLIIDVTAIVNCCCEVVYNLHHTHCILRKVKVLLWVRIYVPFKLLELWPINLSQLLEEEMKTHSTLAVAMCIFVYFQLHDLKMEKI